MRKKRMTAAEKARYEFAKSGGEAVKKKYGKDHYKDMANKRWHPEAAKKRK